MCAHILLCMYINKNNKNAKINFLIDAKLVVISYGNKIEYYDHVLFRKESRLRPVVKIYLHCYGPESFALLPIFNK